MHSSRTPVMNRKLAARVLIAGANLVAVLLVAVTALLAIEPAPAAAFDQVAQQRGA
jgi:hypothetical protein